MNNKPFHYSLYDTSHQTTIKFLLKYNLVSFLGRVFYNKTPKLTNDRNLLNLGCGTTKFDGWINADFFTGYFFWKKHLVKPDWMLDLRYPLKCKDNLWDGVFTEHVLEHLYPNQVLSLLVELHRTLKPGAWLRVSVPDLAKHIRYYNGEPCEEVYTLFPTGCEAIHSLTQCWGHVSVWDTDLLAAVMREAGFDDIRSVGFGVGSDPTIVKDDIGRRDASLYMEAMKK